MLERIILCATSQQLTAGIWRAGKLDAYQVYQNNEAGQAEFTQFLSDHPKKSVYLLADAVEEDYRLESLPHTTGSARRELVERKLAQLYRGVAYRAAHFVNRDKDKRKDDRFLFISLNNADFMQGWVRAIEAVQVPLVGIYLLPMMSEILVQRLKLTAPHLLLSEHLNSGLRQTYLHNGSLRISRLAPIPADMLDRLPYFYLSETEKTQLYIISQRFITRDTKLNMVLPTLNESSPQICRSIEKEHDLICESANLAEIAQQFKLDISQLESNPELMHMHLLATGSAPDNLASPSLVRHHKILSLRRTIGVITAVVMLAGLVTAGVYLKQSMDFESDTAQAEIDTRIQEQRYREVAKDFPTAPIPSTDLQTAADISQSIKQYAKTPARMMQVLSAALDAAPEIQVNRMFWVQTNNMMLDEEDKSLSSASASNAVKPAAYAVPDATVLYEVGYINGEIRRFNGDYRTALNMVNRLAERLKADAAIEHVEILQAPVNVSSYSNLQGSTTDEKAALQPAALFKLKLILKREVPAT